MTDLLASKVPTSLIPANESERLAALYRYDILDTSAEAAFDRVTSLAARLFQMPTVLISLVDESRVWFKSRIGCEASEIPRNALCSFAVLTDEPLIVPDTQLDERFVCNPFVLCEPGLRFYAGAPLLSHDGFNLGTLCILDKVPHDPLTAEQQATLVDLAAIVVDELELRLSARQMARVDAALLDITRGLSTVTGGEFMDALVQHLAQVLNTNYAYIGLIESHNPKVIRTIATCADGQIVNNLEYALEDTPCWEVIKQRRICCYPRNVQSYFPNAPLLKPLLVESYAATPFFDAGGQMLGVLGVMDGKPLQDVHLAKSLLIIFSDRIATEIERQQAQQALAESEERLQLAIGGMQLGTFDWDLVADKILTSAYFNQLIGLEPDAEFTLAKWESILHPDDLIGATTSLKRAFADTSDLVQEYRVIFPDGSIHWINGFGKFYCDSAGRPVRLAGGLIEITDRKQAELNLRRSEEFNRRILENNQDCIKLLDLDGQLLYMNDNGQKLFEVDDFAKYDRSVWMQFWGGSERELAQAAFENALAGTISKFEGQCSTPTGTPKWWEVNVIPLEDKDGNVEQLLVISHDLTDRRYAEDELRLSRALAQYQLLEIEAIYQTAPIGLAVLDVDLRFQRVNRTLAEMNGVTMADHIGRTVREVIPHLADGNEPLLRQVLETGKPLLNLELSGETDAQPGIYRTWIANYYPLTDGNGQSFSINVVVQEITDRKIVEAALRESKTQIDFLLAAAEFGEWSLNLSDGKAQRSLRHDQIFGYESLLPEWTSEMFLDHVLPEDVALIERQYQDSMENDKCWEFECRIRRADDQVRWIWVSGYAYKNDKGEDSQIMVGLVADITDRKQKELNSNFLAEIQKDLASIEDISQMLDVVGEKIRAWFSLEIFTVGDVDLAANTCMPFHTNSEQGTLIQVTDYSLSDFFSERHLQQLQAGETVAINDVYEEPGIKDQGSAYEAYPVRSLLALSHIIDEEWKFLMTGSRREDCIWRKDEIDLMSELMLRIYLEIERSRSEATLEKLNQRFESAMDAVDGIIFEWNIETNLVYRSHGLFNLIGVEVEDAPPTREWWVNLVHPEDQTDPERFFAQLEANNDRFQEEYRVRHADGHWIDVWERAYVRRNEAGEIVNMIGFTSDISDRKRLEKKLEERNQELNRFSHTVSHDLKAPLRGISNLATWISDDLPSTIDPDILANLELMRSRISRMDSLIDGLLNYAKVGNTEASLETFSVEQLLKEIVDSLSISDSFVVELPAELPPIRTNRVLLSQVLANLIGNAYKHHNSPDGRIQVTVQADAEMWRFSVTDDGPGIAPENQGQVFDMFKTVAGTDKNNSGIGLSIVKKIVETQGGQIKLESQIGMGTTFNFTWILEI